MLVLFMCFNVKVGAYVVYRGSEEVHKND